MLEPFDLSVLCSYKRFKILVTANKPVRNTFKYKVRGN